MPTSNLITILEELHELHKDLLSLAVKKTDSIKAGDMEALTSIITEEQKFINGIHKLEEDRKNITRETFPQLVDPSIQECVEVLEKSEGERIMKLAEGLTSTLLQLKDQNTLNQQLVHQSMQFVNVSLNLLRPQPESMNYTSKGTGEKQVVADTIFNSEA